MHDFSRCTCRTHAQLGKQRLTLNSKTNVRADLTQPLTLVVVFNTLPTSLTELLFLHHLGKDGPKEPTVLETSYNVNARTVTAVLSEVKAGCSYSVHVNHECFFERGANVPKDLVYGFTILHPSSGPPASHAQRLHLVVKTLTGQTLRVHASSLDTVHDVKGLLTVKEGTPPEHQRIIFNKREVQNASTLHDCGIKDGDQLHMVLRLRGNGDFLHNHLKRAFIGGTSLLTNEFPTIQHNMHNGNNLVLEFDTKIQFKSIENCLQLSSRFGKKVPVKCTREEQGHTLIADHNGLEEGVTYRLEIDGNCFRNESGYGLISSTLLFTTMCAPLPLYCITEKAFEQGKTKTGRGFCLVGGCRWKLLSQLPWQLWEHDMKLSSTPDLDQVMLHLVHPDTKVLIPLKTDQDVLKLNFEDLIVVSIENTTESKTTPTSPSVPAHTPTGPLKPVLPGN
eukprot:TRINITY_DN10627_c0_g1_i1.p1 TRINITY_DN10627_c0_g1~~TRINITY_DN10627_c0_g1_i1.p1  ORF type:complete len:450 (-),score=15.19 TRINITY_DN10627_c0_g1_i1:105-1454(-)